MNVPALRLNIFIANKFHGVPYTSTKELPEHYARTVFLDNSVEDRKQRDYN